MAGERERSDTGPIAVVLIVLLVVLPFVYVLSYGPAYWLLHSSCDHSPDWHLWSERVEAFYWPLHWLGSYSITIDMALSEYRNYWYGNKLPLYAP